MPQLRMYIDVKFDFVDGEELAPRIEALITEHLVAARETARTSGAPVHPAGTVGISVYPEGSVRHMVYVDP